MSYFDLTNDVKSIITKHLSNDMNINNMFMSKHYDFQKLLFGQIVFDDDFNNIKKTPERFSDDDDFNTGKMYKISNLDILF